MTEQLTSPCSMGFYLYRQEKVEGPFSLNEVKRMRRESVLADDSLVCAEGEETWASLVEVLQQEFTPPPLPYCGPKPPPLPAIRKGKHSSGLAVAVVVAVCVVLAGSLAAVLSRTPATTSLVAIGAVDRLPLGATKEQAEQFEFSYNQWGRAEEVLNAARCETAPFRAKVKVLEQGNDYSKVRVLSPGFETLEGWVPSDWLATHSGPIARRENGERQQTRIQGDSFIRLTRDQLKAKLGEPIKIDTGRNHVDGGFEIWIYDTSPGKETFFSIWTTDGFVSSGQYKGIELRSVYQ